MVTSSAAAQRSKKARVRTGKAPRIIGIAGFVQELRVAARHGEPT